MTGLRTCFQVCVILSIAIIVCACSRDHEATSRPFRMGFSPYPYQVSVESGEYISGKLAVEADIINHRLDKGVPWEEALRGDAFPESMRVDWAFRKNLAKGGHKVYVSVTPFNAELNGLAACRGAAENTPLERSWKTRSFNDEKVKTAYLNYCKRVIDHFGPDYFALSMDANVLYRNNPAAWPAYLELHDYVYTELKRVYPDLPVFSSLSGALLLDGFVPHNDYVLQRLAAMQVLERSDYYAVSFYPLTSAEAPTTWPGNIFDELFSVSTKPVIVAETAYTAERIAVPLGEGTLVVDTSPMAQKMFVDALLTASARWNAEFVIWFTLRDFDVRDVDLSEEAYAAMRGNAGFYDDEGNPRPALNTWRDYFRRMVERRP